MPRAHLTDISVRALKPPARGQVTYWDQSTPLFGLRISAGGAKTWTIMHGVNRKRTSIGRYPILGLAKARERAKELLAEITLGKSQPPTIRFADLLTLFLSASESRNKPRTTKDYKRLLSRHFLAKFRLRQVHEITAQDISAVIDKLAKTPSEQNHALTAAKAIFRFAVRRHYLTHSPCEGIEQAERNVLGLVTALVSICERTGKPKRDSTESSANDTFTNKDDPSQA